jgi:hypothetical protein
MTPGEFECIDRGRGAELDSQLREELALHGASKSNYADSKQEQRGRRLAIEEEFVSSKSPTQIAKDWSLRDRTTLYRHAWATGLMEKRRRNVRAAVPTENSI